MGERSNLLSFLSQCIAVLLFVVTFVFESTNALWHYFYWPLVAATTVIFLFIVASLRLIWGVRDFTSELKHALVLYFIGYALFGITQLLPPFLTAVMNFQHSWWLVFILMAPTFITAMTILIIGTFALRRIFNLKEDIAGVPWWFDNPPPLILAIIFGLLPHPRVHMPTLAYIVLDMFLLWNAHILLLSAYSLLVRIKRMAGVLYTEALAWLIIAVAVMAAAAYSYAIGVALFGNEQNTTLSLVIILILICSGILLIRAAYAFQKIKTKVDIVERSVARDFFGKPVTSQLTHPTSSVDIVIYAANLVSIPSAIDTALDRMRLITSRIGNQQTMSDNDQRVLKELYLEIEDYLVHREIMRKFTKESLREEISRKLHITTETAGNTFWSQLT